MVSSYISLLFPVLIVFSLGFSRFRSPYVFVLDRVRGMSTQLVCSTSFNMAPEMSVLLKLRAILVKLIVRKLFEAHGYKVSDVEFNVTEDEYSKLHKDFLAIIATRVASTELGEHNVTKDEYMMLLKLHTTLVKFMSELLKWRTILVRLKEHGYKVSDEEFNVTKDKYPKLSEDILAIATRVPSTKLHKHNVTEEEYSELLQDILLYTSLVNLKSVHLKLRTVVVKLIARKPFKAHVYPFSNVEFNVTEDEYSKLHKDILAIATRVPSTELAEHNVTEDERSELLKDMLAYSTQVPSTELDKHKVLPWQTGPQNQPPRWILTDLTVSGNVTTIALRIDNLYLVGFTDRYGHWYTFDEYTELIPGSTGIEFPGSYAGLGYKGLDGRAKLRDLPLNRTTVSTAVQKLLYYDRSLTVKEELQEDFAQKIKDLQEALTSLVLVISEATRFTIISDNVSSGWDSESYISRTDILVEWKGLSYELLCGWDKEKRKGKVENLEKKLGLKGKEAAYLLLNVLILPTEEARRNKN